VIFVLSKVLDAALTDEQRRSGLYLKEREDCLLLMRMGRVVEILGKASTVEDIRREADKHIESG